MKLLPDDPKKKNVLIVAVAFVLGLYAFHSFWYTGQQEEIDEMTSRFENLDDQNRRAQIIATRGGAELEEKLALYERHLLRLEQLIPQNEEVPALLNSMTLEARQNGLEFVLIRPEPLEAGPYYTKHSYEIGVAGRYHDVGRFLSAIASLPRIVSPIDLDMTVLRAQQARPNRNSADEGAEQAVAAQFRIQTYVVPPPGGPPATEPSGDEISAGGGGK